MRVVKPIRRVCHICRMEFDSFATLELYCKDCKPEAERRWKEAENIRRRNRRKAAKKPAVPEKPPVTLAQHNAEQRARGLTYGGKPILQCTPREPKFLEGARSSWRKSDLELL